MNDILSRPLHYIVTRRRFMLGSMIGFIAAATARLPGFGFSAKAAVLGSSVAPTSLNVALHVNGEIKRLSVDSRATLLDTLREQLHLTGSKKGCDHGQCGACTVLVGGRRINSCLTLAVMHDGEEITTIEGLGTPEHLHPLQAAFIKHDGFQCGYCTPGQICSSIGMIDEAKRGMASYVSDSLGGEHALSGEEIRERMSGNICRCAAYPNIVAAIQETVGA